MNSPDSPAAAFPTARTVAQAQADAVCLAVEDLRVSLDTPTGPITVLDGLGFTLRRGEIGCLLGASGCGKTTALRAVAGFVRPTRGTVAIAGRTASSPDTLISPEHRGVGVVFQDYALFPHLNVSDNVGFGLRNLNPSRRRARVREMLDLVGLHSVASRFPHELSGGQQQRIALARALAPNPALLLLDEPFSNLDPDLRESLALELRDLLKEHGTTSLLVTHDQYEAFALADSVGVMEQGRIAQWDPAYRLYHHPRSRSVADFVGMGVFVPGRLREREGESLIEVEAGSLPIRDDEDRRRALAHARDGDRVLVLLRPDDVVHDDESPVHAQVQRKAFRGAQFLYTLRLPSGAQLLALVPSHHDHSIGQWIGIRFEADHIVTFPLD